MGAFDDLNDGIAPEHGMPDGSLTDPSDDFEIEFEDESEPIEHDDIRNTPVSMPDISKRRKASLQKELEAWYAMIGTGIFPFDPQVATVVIESAPSCAEALNDLAQKNPRVKKALNSLLTAGAYGAVISAHLPIAVIIATKYTPLGEQYGAFLSKMHGQAA